MSLFSSSDSIEIREVWSTNLNEEFDFIRDIVNHYPYVALDTEYPGEIHIQRTQDLHNQFLCYHTIRSNVNDLHLIQLGLTFCNENADLPTSKSGKHIVWQFNFREFDPNVDPCAKNSFDLLKKSGIDFGKNRRYGVNLKEFGELLTSSGVVMSENMCWITFHCAYDFGYVVKLLSGKKLPETRADFFEYMRVYFPVLYDMKHMMRFSYGKLVGGLDKLAASLGTARSGTAHQAGSDSLLSARAFMRLKERPDLLEKRWDSFAGVMHVLGPV